MARNAGVPVDIYLRTIGGEPANMATLAPKLGPLGVPPKKASDEIQKVTKDWKGIKVSVKLTILNRQPTCEIVPSSAALVLKALNEPPRNRKVEKNVVHDGNLTLEDVYSISRTMRPRSQSKTFVGVVMEILGTCNSIGCTVEGESPKVIQQKIREKEIMVPEA